MNAPLLRDLAVFFARLAVGVVMAAHGWQKLNVNGIDATASGFDAMGIPLPTIAAWFTIGVELGGGILLILGLAVPVVGVLIAATMLGALYFAHLEAGLYAADGGYEYVLVLTVTALLVAAVGAGRLSLDQLVWPRVAGGVTAAERVPA